MKSFLSDRPRVKTPTVNVSVPVPFPSAAGGAKPASGSARPAGHGHPAGGHTVASKVECVREGDRVTRIIVTCACGEQIEVDCLYAAGG
jgi:hypothetical protein